MEPVLLLGNGINRATQTQSWRGLVYNLSLLVENENVRRDLMSVEPGSLSLLMEVLVAQANLGEADIRQRIASYFSGGISPIYREIEAKTDLQHILTTNYDTHIEQALNALDPASRGIQNASSKNETKYNLFRRKRVGTRSIWHIHGIAETPGSIQLGFEHYSGQLGKIVSYRDKDTHRLRQSQYSDADAAWIEPFLWGDTRIMGLGLAEDEIDIWWAVQYWSRHRHERGFGNLIFYSTDQPNEKSIMRRDTLLRGFGVTVVHAQADLLNAGAYEKIFTDWLTKIGDR